MIDFFFSLTHITIHLVTPFIAMLTLRPQGLCTVFREHKGEDLRLRERAWLPKALGVGSGKFTEVREQERQMCFSDYPLNNTNWKR